MPARETFRAFAHDETVRRVLEPVGECSADVPEERHDLRRASQAMCHSRQAAIAATTTVVVVYTVTNSEKRTSHRVGAHVATASETGASQRMPYSFIFLCSMPRDSPSAWAVRVTWPPLRLSDL